MKIQVKDLGPNPYRKIESYPIDKDKVERLKNSIKEKSFWDNILARKVNGKYQLAYGHHRLQALKELGIEEIDIPVRELSDATMLQIMAEENLDWSTAPAVMIQTIQAAKDFLDAELAKCETLAHAGNNTNVKELFTTNSQFQQCKQEGIGRETLLKFLGGNWKEWMIKVALRVLNDNSVDRESIYLLPTVKQAQTFHSEVKRHEVPKQQQRKIAKAIAEEGIGFRDIPAEVAKHSTVLLEPEVKTETKELELLVDSIGSAARALEMKFKLLRSKMARLNVTELKGVKVRLSGMAIGRLIKEWNILEKD